MLNESTPQLRGSCGKSERFCIFGADARCAVRQWAVRAWRLRWNRHATALKQQSACTMNTNGKRLPGMVFPDNSPALQRWASREDARQSRRDERTASLLPSRRTGIRWGRAAVDQVMNKHWRASRRRCRGPFGNPPRKRRRASLQPSSLPPSRSDIRKKTSSPSSGRRALQRTSDCLSDRMHKGSQTPPGGTRCRSAVARFMARGHELARRAVHRHAGSRASLLRTRRGSGTTVGAMGALLENARLAQLAATRRATGVAG